MRNPIIRALFAVLLVSVLPVVAVRAEEAGEREATEAYHRIVERWETEVQPVLSTHCIECHGAAKQSGGLDLRTLTSLLEGADSGAVIDTTQPAASRLLEVLQAEAEPSMPPETPLPEEHRKPLVSWAAWFDRLDIDAFQKFLRSLPSDGTREPKPGGLPENVPPRMVIDLEIRAGWDEDVSPRQLCDDATYVRRLYLDLCGRIPRREERDAFLASTDSRKREQLVEQLLNSDEHPRHLANIFDAVLMGREPTAVLEKRRRHGWYDYLQRSFAQNRPWDQIAREILLARPDDSKNAGAIWYLYERDNEYQQIAEAVARGVFGVQIQCAQCHDHPLAPEILQRHYWGLVAFFNRGKNVEEDGQPRVSESAVGGFSMFTNLEGESQPNRLVFLKAEEVPEMRPAEGEKEEDREELYHPSDGTGPKIPRFSRREAFVDEVLRGHPLIARSMVNRLWAWCMGRGLVHPVDALDSVHPPSHPRLLDWLSDDFARNGYDVRRMIREIALSETYQLTSRSEAIYDPADFQIAATKPLTAEMLYQSFLVALQIPLPDESTRLQQAASLRTAFPDVMQEMSLGNLRQALLLTNGPDLHVLASPEHSPYVASLCEKDTSQEIVEDAFVQILGRSPAEEEAARAIDFLESRQDRLTDGVQQFVWALLTTAEFRFNH